MMNKKEIRTMAEMTAEIVLERLKQKNGTAGENEEFVDSNEAARILGLSPTYLRSIKDRFPHKKVGNNNQGRILFKKSSLITNYTK